MPTRVFIDSTLLLFVLHNPFLLSIYLLNLIQELDRKTFLAALLQGTLISAVVFSLVPILLFPLSRVDEAMSVEMAVQRRPTENVTAVQVGGLGVLDRKLAGAVRHWPSLGVPLGAPLGSAWKAKLPNMDGRAHFPWYRNL
jgi:hypothetical protein